MYLNARGCSFFSRWKTGSIYRTLFYDVLLNSPKFESARRGKLWECLMAGEEARFRGLALPSGHACGFLCGWGLLPSLQGGFFLLLWVRVASCPQLPLTRQSLVTHSALEGSYWKRKPCFSGGMTTIESFKRLNNNACSRSVSLTAGENSMLNLSCL